MTTERNAQGVDVLAVMDRTHDVLRVDLNNADLHGKLAEARAAVAELVEADVRCRIGSSENAAVAELVEAVKAERLVVRATVKPTREQLTTAIERTDAALARVQGGAA